MVMAAVLSASLPGWARNLVVSTRWGSLDWSNWIIETVGRGKAPPEPLNRAQARAAAKTAALQNAREHLMRVLEELWVDAGMRLGRLMAQDPEVRAKAEALAQAARVIDVRYRGEDSAEALISVRLTEGFADAVLPLCLKPIKAVTQPPKEIKEEGATGLVVDCRGLAVQPALALQIVDEDGHQVYGPRYASRDEAVRGGLARYIRGLEAAQKDPRVGPRPLVIRGLRTVPNAGVDLVVSNADGERIREDARNLYFLQKCRVVVALD